MQSLRTPPLEPQADVKRDGRPLGHRERVPDKAKKAMRPDQAKPKSPRESDAMPLPGNIRQAFLITRPHVTEKVYPTFALACTARQWKIAARIRYSFVLPPHELLNPDGIRPRNFLLRLYLALGFIALCGFYVLGATSTDGVIARPRPAIFRFANRGGLRWPQLFEGWVARLLRPWTTNSIFLGLGREKPGA